MLNGIIMKKANYFILFALLLLLGLGYKTYEQYRNIEQTQDFIVLEQSRSIAYLIKAFRHTYQDAFLKNNISIDEKMINLLPVKTVFEISQRFSAYEKGDILIRTISDRPRNPDNKANLFEEKMINYFRENSNEKENFIHIDDAYYYTKPLKIKTSCLKCHGKREDAIPSIREKYTKAYDYKLGEIRGLVNITIKEQEIFASLHKDFNNALIVTALLYFFLLTVIYLLIRSLNNKEEQYTHRLEKEITQASRKLIKQKETFETLFEKSSDGILILDEKGNFIEGNEKIILMLKLSSKEELFIMTPLELSPEKQPDGQLSSQKIEEMIYIAKQNGWYQFEWILRRMDGENFWAEITLTLVELNGQEVIHAICREISEKKKAEKKLVKQAENLRYHAHHDILTGLPNRVLFAEELKRGIEEADIRDGELALFFIDLDQFKQINDSLGHEIGDRVLNLVTTRLKEMVEDKYFLSRLGGDEFTIIMKNVAKRSDLVLLAQAILDALKEPLYIENNKLYISSSIGISLYPRDGKNANNLLKYADAAMYKAKEEGRNTYQFYTIEMTEQAYEQIIMKAALQRGLEEEEFVIYYQPQVNAKNGKIIGVEALIRWQHPIMGFLEPAKFITVAKETGLLRGIDQWMMRKAMYEVREWHRQGLHFGHLSLNVTITQLKDELFVEMLLQMLDDTNFEPAWLELEITEGEVMQRYDEIIAKLKLIYSKGIHIAIDDFGTGHSSLAYLKRLPVNKLKIDRSFIVDLPHDEESVAIVKAIISLANILGLTIIAEGVETEKQQAFLIANECDNIQGYYYSRPMPAEELQKILLEQKRHK
ncbi:MAG: GGDEF domain-containing protein [Epsilonproteobacteria bacterium]|nr:MAG: GGDEF domain-containing protein [Campylobacterota bacterium]